MNSKLSSFTALCLVKKPRWKGRDADGPRIWKLKSLCWIKFESSFQQNTYSLCDWIEGVLHHCYQVVWYTSSRATCSVFLLPISQPKHSELLPGSKRHVHASSHSITFSSFTQRDPFFSTLHPFFGSLYTRLLPLEVPEPKCCNSIRPSTSGPFRRQFRWYNIQASMYMIRFVCVVRSIASKKHGLIKVFGCKIKKNNDK